MIANLFSRGSQTPQKVAPLKNEIVNDVKTDELKILLDGLFVVTMIRLFYAKNSKSLMQLV